MNKEVLEALVQEVLDEMSMTGTGASVTPGTGEGVATKYAFAKKKDGNKIAKDYIKTFGGSLAPSVPNRASKAIDYKQLYEDESLNENYAKFRNQTKTRTKPEQYHQAVKQVKRKVEEINRLFEYMNRLQAELSESDGGLKHKKYTENAITQIKESTKKLFFKSTKLK
jgi:hypothetical protein